MGLIKITQKTTDKNPSRYYSRKQEVATAKKFDGQLTPNSGATRFSKGDLTLSKTLIECKTKMTDSDSISIKKEWLEKNNKEALFMGKPYSALAFNFGPNQPNYYIIDEEMFEYLIEYLNTI